MCYLRYLISVVLIIIAFSVISKEFRGTYYNIPSLFKEANKSIILLLVIFQGLSYLGDGLLSQILLTTSGFRVKLKDTLKIAVLGVVGYHVAPFVGGTIITYQSYKKLGVPTAIISFLVFSWTVFIWMTYIFFFLLSLLLLPNLIFNFVSSKIIFAALFGVILVSICGFILFRQRGKYLIWFLNILSKPIDKIIKIFHKKSLFISELFKKFISDFCQCFSFLWRNKKKIPLALFFSLLFYFGDIFTLYFSFLVFGFKPNFPLLIFGYTLSLVLTLLSLVPGAPGIMEASLIVIFIKLGFPAHVVLFSSLLYRLFSYWLPLPIGIFSYFTFKTLKKGNYAKIS